MTYYIVNNVEVWDLMTLVKPILGAFELLVFKLYLEVIQCTYSKWSITL